MKFGMPAARRCCTSPSRHEPNSKRRNAGGQVCVLANRSTCEASNAEVQPRRCLRIVQRIHVEAPSGQRFRVAVHNTNTALADLVAGEHRQPCNSRQQLPVLLLSS